MPEGTVSACEACAKRLPAWGLRMIFIVGGDGFVGSAFARYCKRQGLEFAIVEPYNYRQYVGKRCDLLINANGNSKKFLARESPLEEFDLSVRSVRATLVDFPCDFYLHFSSCDVYPDCSSPATTREDSTPDPRTQSPYGFHKHLAEQCVRHAAGRWLIVRYGGFVGPNLRKNPIYDILHGGPLWLDPESELQFLHTDRAAEIVFTLVDRGVTDEIVNVCGRGLVRLQEVIDHAGTSVPVQPGSPKVRYDVSIEKLQRWVGSPETRAAVLAFVDEELGKGCVRQ